MTDKNVVAGDTDVADAPTAAVNDVRFER